MPTIAEVARTWVRAGVSLIPILPNGTKRPPVKWDWLMRQHPSDVDIAEWFENGHNYGIALVCGRISGNMEMLELEGRAAEVESLNRLMAAFTRHGLLDLWAMLNGPNGYSEWSPSGGLHLLYRISDHEVPGNEKVARRAATEEELAAKPADRWKVMSETRGEGGYVIAAPTPGICHPTGEPWQLISGAYGQLPTISWDQRCRLHAAIREALDEVPQIVAPSPVPAPRILDPSPGALVVRGAGTLTPGDDFEAQVDWADDLLLGGAGWTLESRHGQTRHWTRPGKDRREGASATTGRDPARDRLYVFSSSTEFEQEVPHTKFHVYAILHHGGDHSAAAGALARLGFGERRPALSDEWIVPPEDRGKAEPAPAAEVVEPTRFYTFDETGNAARLWDRVKGRYRWVYEEKDFYVFDGVVWRRDFDGSIIREMVAVTNDMSAEAIASDNDTLAKWAKASRSQAKLTGATKLMCSSEAGATVRTSDFNPHRHLLNVANGVLNLKTREFGRHDAALMMTRTFGASYDPAATCPHFDKFMAEVLPDEAMRSYVQRALGYSLLGDADRRAMFLIYGPSGTGKSTLIETMREVFGDYGATAASGTFRARRSGEGPTNDLHGLRGRRFVTTSETAQDASFDEDTLKRLTGRDRIVSRDLYERNQEWTPECALWLATNHPPKFNSDDDAIWARAKLIPFLTEFRDTEREVPDLARSVLIPEAAGILNWLLAGLADFLEHGLGEPAEVKQAASDQRSQSDSVIRFLDDKIEDGILVVESGRGMPTRELFLMYLEWCRESGETRALGSRRFINRVESCGKLIKYDRTGGRSAWRGIGRAPNAAILGTFMAGGGG